MTGNLLSLQQKGSRNSIFMWEENLQTLNWTQNSKPSRKKNRKHLNQRRNTGLVQVTIKWKYGQSLLTVANQLTGISSVGNGTRCFINAPNFTSAVAYQLRALNLVNKLFSQNIQHIWSKNCDFVIDKFSFYSKSLFKIPNQLPECTEFLRKLPLSSLSDVTSHLCEAWSMRSTVSFPHEEKIRKWTRILVGKSFSKLKDFIPICLTIT